MRSGPLQRTVRRMSAVVASLIAGLLLISVRTSPAYQVGRTNHALLELLAQLVLWMALLYLIGSFLAEYLLGSPISGVNQESG